MYESAECGYSGTGAEAIAHARAIWKLDDIQPVLGSTSEISPDIQWEVVAGHHRPDILYYNSSDSPDYLNVGIVEVKGEWQGTEDGTRAQLSRYVNYFERNEDSNVVPETDPIFNTINYTDWFLVKVGECPDGLPIPVHYQVEPLEGDHEGILWVTEGPATDCDGDGDADASIDSDKLKETNP